jgi:hypothetical protein
VAQGKQQRVRHPTLSWPGSNAAHKERDTA